MIQDISPSLNSAQGHVCPRAEFSDGEMMEEAETCLTVIQ